MFVSYAQNFEDVMLWRALKDVKNGFYLDIGAQDPVVDSVSRGFYEKGWRGVHLEPTPAYVAKLRQNRPDETVLQNAIGEGGGSIPFFEFPETGLSTGDADFAAQHEAKGFNRQETRVSLLPLADLLERYGNRDIHWMKIDVEGMEASVLASWGLSPVRPWIVVVESTVPLSSERAEVAWQHHLIERDYELCYFDGLNCYFVRRDHPDLKEAFSVPPNVFDGFTLSGTATSPMSARMIRLMAEARDQRDHTAQRLSEVTEQADLFHSQILSLHDSFSWRITSPLRVFSRISGRALRRSEKAMRRLLMTLKRALRFGVELLRRSLSGCKSAMRHVLRLVVKLFRSNPRLHTFARKAVNQNAILRRIASRSLKISNPSSVQEGRYTMSLKGGNAHHNSLDRSSKELNTLSRVGRLNARQTAIR